MGFIKKKEAVEKYEMEIDGIKEIVLEIREIIGKNLIAMAVSFTIGLLVLPFIARDLFRLVWELSSDEDVMAFIYVDSGNAIIDLVAVVIVGVVLYPIFDAMIKIVKFIFLLILIIIIGYTMLHLIVSCFIQTHIKIRYVLLINAISSIITIVTCFYSIPYIVEFQYFINQVFAIDFDITDLMGNFIDILNLLWDYALKMYKPILQCILMTFGITTSLYIIFRKWIVVTR